MRHLKKDVQRFGTRLAWLTLMIAWRFGYADTWINRNESERRGDSLLAPFEWGGELDVVNSLDHHRLLGAVHLNVYGIQLQYESQTGSNQAAVLDVGWGYRHQVGSQALVGFGLFANVSLGGFLSGYDGTIEYAGKRFKIAFVGHTASMLCGFPNFIRMDGGRMKVEMSPALLWNTMPFTQAWRETAFEIDVSIFKHHAKATCQQCAVGMQTYVCTLLNSRIHTGLYFDFSHWLNPAKKGGDRLRLKLFFGKQRSHFCAFDNPGEVAQAKSEPFLTTSKRHLPLPSTGPTTVPHAASHRKTERCSHCFSLFYPDPPNLFPRQAQNWFGKRKICPACRSADLRKNKL